MEDGAHEDPLLPLMLSSPQFQFSLAREFAVSEALAALPEGADWRRRKRTEAKAIRDIKRAWFG